MSYEEEFRRLFAQEAARRLDALVTAALALEEGGGTPDHVAAMFRDAHTLKGSAGVVGFTAVAAALHELEQTLDDLRGGRRPADAAAADAVLAGVDRVRALIEDAMAVPLAGGGAAAELEAIARERAAAAGQEDAASAAPPAAPEAADERAPTQSTGEAGPTGGGAAAATQAAGRQGPPSGEAAPPQTTGAAAPPSGGEAAPTQAAGELTTPGTPPAAAAPPSTGAPLDGGAIPVPVERVDAVVRLSGEAAAAHLRLGRLLADRFGADPTTLDEYRDLQRLLGDLQDTALRSRTVALGAVAGPLQRAARDLARERGKQIRWALRGEATELDRHVLERLREPLVALVRNAVDHGLEPPDERRAAGKPVAGSIEVTARRIGAEIEITVADDGRGIDPAGVSAAAGRALDHAGALQAVFEPGVSTAAAVTGISGRGVGLDAVRDAVAAVRGRVALESRTGAGTRVTLAVPLTVAVVPCLILEAAGRRWGLPLSAAVSAHAAADVPAVAGEPVAAAPLPDVLGLAPAEGATTGPALVIAAGRDHAAVRVDAITGEREVMLKDVGAVAGRLDLVAGAAVEPDGAVLVVLDPSGVVAAARALAAGRSGPLTRVLARAPAPGRRSVLVVDDALTVRELQRSVLERAGYEARVAGDGAEALRMLRDRRADAIVTDVEMPIMDGVALTAAIRATPGLERLPVIVLSSREGEADRRRALDAGADEYLGKSEFDEAALLGTIARRLTQAG